MENAIPPPPEVGGLLANLMSEFKIGEVIRLKSGGPRMTINYVPRQGKPVVLFYEANWFTDDGKLQHGYFSPETIEAAPDPDNTYRSDPDRGPLPASSLVQ